MENVANFGASQHDTPRLAYLLSAYPAISHTFLLNEVSRLRERGFIIDVASINKPHWEEGTLCDAVKQAAETTFYVKEGGLVQVVLLVLKLALTCPLVVCRGLLAVARLEGMSPAATMLSICYLVEAFILGDWLRRRGHTHLHIHFGGPVATVGMLTSMAWRIPYSLSIHGPEEFYSTDRLHLRRKVERATFVLCISNHCRSQLMKLCDPGEWNKLYVARLGVDVSLFQPRRKVTNDRCLEIVCVGRLVPDKGHLVLLRSFMRLVLRGHRVRLRLIGDGIERRRLEQFIEENSLHESVILEGALGHDATRRLLERSDIFVLASFAEGLPVALMEAMAMEIPCVSTYIAGIPELIRSEVEGLLVAASSEEELFGALDRLLASPKLRRDLARSGRQRVLERYDLDVNVSVIAEIFRHQLYEPAGVPRSAVRARRPRGGVNERLATAQQIIAGNAMAPGASQINCK